MTNNSDDKQNWREKYLDALDTQELLEQRYQQQQELLRRVLVRVSLAADGQDELLDQLMAQLRETLRRDKTADLGQLLERIEVAAIHSEQQRERGALKLREALAAALKPWQDYALPRELKHDIQNFVAELPRQSDKLRLYPQLLQRLVQLQQQVLAQLGQPKTGLLERLRGGKTLALPEAKQASPAPEPDSDPTTTPATAPEVSPLLAGSRGDGAPPPAHWLGQLQQLLQEFIDSLAHDSQLQAPLAALRQQLAQGASAEAALQVLAQLRQRVMEAYLATNQAFADYLNRVNGELADIALLLGGAVQTSANGQQASRQLQAQMLQEMNDLEDSAAQATDLSQLKQSVQSQLGNIRQALDRYQQTEQAQQQLAQQLNQLGEKIRVMESEAEHSRANLEQQRRLALQDSLTQLPNRAAYEERARTEVQRWERYQRPLSLAVFDIDHFKQINDSHGHQAGDRVIKVIGNSIAKRLREVDFFCRYGGEEFVALLPETSSDNALILLEKIRTAIAAAAFHYKEQPLKISISIGVTQFQAGDTLEAAFDRADQALYAAKAGGRNATRLA